MNFRPSELAFKYCSGIGIELGAATHNPFNLPNSKNVAPCDGINFFHKKDLENYLIHKEEQGKYGYTPAKVDLIGDFQKIPVSSNSLDYIVSSHVIEHEPNPIAALIESFRALKENGVFFCIFPKRNSEPSFDIFRRLTTLDEFIECYRQNITTETSPFSWRGHYHVYSMESMISLINWINNNEIASFLIEAIEETDSKVGNGHTIVLRKYPPHIIKDLDYSLLIESEIQKKITQMH